MKFTFSKQYKAKKQEINEFLSNFDDEGTLLNDGTRNKIKLFELNGTKINVKSFKVPNVVNKFAYRFLRKSKAKRSFQYAHCLLSKGVGTPFPVAFAEEKGSLTFQKSFYISEHLPYDLTYRELVHQPEFPEHEEILRAFTRFTYDLHEKEIEFLDHSPGNTLIQVNKGNYEFFLVDLNRMNFRKLNFEERMKNFSRLTPKKEMVEVMADEYAKYVNKPQQEVMEKMWYYTTDFQEKFRRKGRLKKKLKFWKK